MDLRDREYFMVVSGFRSLRSFKPTTGVAQRSVIALYAFLVFINELSCVIVTATLLRYADDSKLCLSIRSENHALKLQNVHSLLRWFQKHSLNVNLSKTKFVRYTRKRCPIDHQYTALDGNECEKVSVIKYLGVYFDSKLLFHEHVSFVNREYR